MIDLDRIGREVAALDFDVEAVIEQIECSDVDRSHAIEALATLTGARFEQGSPWPLSTQDDQGCLEALVALWEGLCD